MGNTKAIGRRRRVLRHANRRAQRRFHDAIESGVIFDETARATILYVEAERLVDAIMAPDIHPTPMDVVLAAWHTLGVTVLSRDDEGFEAIVNYTSRMDDTSPQLLQYQAEGR